MAKSTASDVTRLLDTLPAERRDALATVRRAMLKNLPSGYVERVSGKFINYEVPLEVYPKTYNGQPLIFAALASQKNYCALYLIGAYQDPEVERVIRDGFKAAGKKLDMGKSCIRFRDAEDLPLDVIASVVRDSPVKSFIAQHETSRDGATKTASSGRMKR